MNNDELNCRENNFDIVGRRTKYGEKNMYTQNGGVCQIRIE